MFGGRNARDLETILQAKEAKIQDVHGETERLRVEYHALKEQKERLTKETEIDINICMSTIENNEETINNLKRDFELEREKAKEEMANIKKEANEAKIEKDKLENELQSAKRNASTIQQNYDQLLATDSCGGSMDDKTKELINERDKATKKGNLLTDKCKKLIIKCKQQEQQIKEQENQIERQQMKLKLEVETIKNDLTENWSTKLLETEQELERLKDRAKKDLSCLKEEQILQIKMETEVVEETVLSKFSAEKDQWLRKHQSELFEKDTVIQQLEKQIAENMERKNETHENDAEMRETIISELQQKIDFLEEAYENEGNENMKLELQMDKLKDKLTTLTEERTEAYSMQMATKEELSDLKTEKSKLSAALEETKREIGQMRQANIVSQMLDSPLLRDVMNENQEHLAVQNSEDEGETANQEEKPALKETKLADKHDEKQENENEDSEFAGFDAGGDRWDEDQVVADVLNKATEKPKETRVIVNDSESQKPDESKKEAVNDANEVGNKGQGDEWGGGWDDDVLDLEEDGSEATGSRKEKQEMKDDAKEDIIHKQAGGAGEEASSEAPPAMLVPSLQPILPLTQDAAPTSLMSFGGDDRWGDDGFDGWGRYDEEDLPGNLRLSEERTLPMEVGREELLRGEPMPQYHPNLLTISSPEGKHVI